MISGILRQSLQSLARHKVESLVILFSLALALACFRLISMVVGSELQYDRFLPGYEQLYSLDTDEYFPGREPLYLAAAAGPLKGLITREFPNQVEAVTRLTILSFTLRREGDLLQQPVALADPNFFTILRLPLRTGSAETALAQPTNLMLSETAARKYFGDADPIGQTLTFLTPEPRDFTVSAVFRDIPNESHLKFEMVIPLTHANYSWSGSGAHPIDSWNGAYFHTYLKLAPSASPDQITPRLPDLVDRNFPEAIAQMLATRPSEFLQLRLVPFADIHFDGGRLATMKPAGSRASVYILAGIGLMILGIACFNFINMALARYLRRAREFALRKVLGAGWRQIGAQVLLESIVIFALALALGAVFANLAYPYFSAALSYALTLGGTDNPVLILGFIAAGLAGGLVSGIKPAVAMAALNPSHALHHAQPRVGWRLGPRDISVGLQYAVAIALTSAALVIVMQTRFIDSRDLGFNHDNILYLGLNEAGSMARAEPIVERLRQHPDIMDIALSNIIPGRSQEANISVRPPDSPQPMTLGFDTVGYDFFKVLQVKPVAGRVFSRDFGHDRAPDPAPSNTFDEVNVLINQSASRKLGFDTPEDALGARIVHTNGDKQTEFTIVGVVPDMNMRPLRDPVRDEMYGIASRTARIILVRFRPGAEAAVRAAAEDAWRETVTDQPLMMGTLNFALNLLYSEERSWAQMVAGFAAIALIIAAMGLFGLTSLFAEGRKAEVGIRKILGASAPDILRLALWQGLRPILFASLLAWPVAWLIVRDWLNGFAYRLDLNALPFLAASLIALGFGFATILYHALRAAGTHPARVLRHE